MIAIKRNWNNRDLIENFQSQMTWHSYLMKRRWVIRRSSPKHPYFDNFGLSSWQLKTNKYEVTDNQIKQSLIQTKDVYPLYQLQVVLGDDDVKTAPTWP